MKLGMGKFVPCVQCDGFIAYMTKSNLCRMSNVTDGFSKFVCFAPTSTATGVMEFTYLFAAPDGIPEPVLPESIQHNGTVKITVQVPSQDNGLLR